MSTQPTLVVLQLEGGCDPLTTLVPYGDPLYYDNRPTVHIPESDVLRIDGRFGFHPAMGPLKAFWDQGRMAIMNGIGFPNPNYSHFRAMDIWYTAEPTKVVADGWLGKTIRELDPHAENVLSAISFGLGLPRALSLSGVPVASVAELDSYGLLTGLASVDERNDAQRTFSTMYDDGIDDSGIRVPLLHAHPDDDRSRVFRYMGKTGLDAKKGAEILAGVIGRYSSQVRYPDSTIAAKLRGIAQVKLADLGTRVFYTSHGSFDTHAGQLVAQDLLWREVSEAVSAFFADLRAHNAADDVIMLLWTEFGRRVKDNGSGTDHGAATLAMVIGDKVKGGMYGEYPSLEEAHLTMGNLSFNNDFRSTYATILERWLKVEARPIVNGRFEELAFV